MTAVFSLTSASGDLLYYLEEVWSAGFAPYNGNGVFDNPTSSTHTNWGAGNTADYGVVLEGSPLDYAQGGLGGTSDLDTMEFGTGYSYNTASGSGLTGVDLSIDLGGAAPTATFNEAIYSLSHGGALEGATFFGQSFDGLYDYFAEVGTEQNGTSSADALYSFEGNDVLRGNSGIDSFIFDLNGAGLLDTAFSIIGDDTIADFNYAAGEGIVIGLNNAAYDTYAEIIAATSNTASGAVIDLGSYGSITLTGVTVANLSASNFEFV
ncbi:Putative hemolysin-type calcium-binding protein [Neorhizobium galegae bv. orientalis]|nr:Putative hemolysin-type calcium-binding protein [Neorhizobium galegae bv. orientalis]